MNMNTPTATTEFDPNSLKHFFTDETTLLEVYTEELSKPGQTVLNKDTDTVSTLFELVPAIRDAVIEIHNQMNGAQIPKLTKFQIQAVDGMVREYIKEFGELALMFLRFTGPVIEE